MISVGFSTTGRFMSRLIRFVTRGRVSHAWIAFNDPYLRLRFVVQSEPWGLELRPWDRWIGENRMIAQFRIDRPETDLEAAIRQLAAMVGTPYDWRSAARAGWIRFIGRSARGLARGGMGRLMCSEATVRFLQAAGCPSALQLSAERTTPVALLEILRTDPTFIELPNG